MKPALTSRAQKAKRIRKRSYFRLCLYVLLTVAFAFYGSVVLSLVILRWVNPPTTAVQTERRIQALIGHVKYNKSYLFVPLQEISPNLQHAVIAAEDARFFQHHGFDWTQVQIAIKDDVERGRSRGASTITQQLVKNLFLGTSRSFIRKGLEFTIVPLTEILLSKRRILELYLNVIEWAPGSMARKQRRAITTLCPHNGLPGIGQSNSPRYCPRHSTENLAE